MSGEEVQRQKEKIEFPWLHSQDTKGTFTYFNEKHYKSHTKENPILKFKRTTLNPREYNLFVKAM